MLDDKHSATVVVIDTDNSTDIVAHRLNNISLCCSQVVNCNTFRHSFQLLTKGVLLESIVINARCWS